MARAAAIGVTAGVVALGIAVGVQLGHAAIGDIDPGFFEDDASSAFFADLVANRPAPATLTAAESYANELNVSGRGGCPGCENAPGFRYALPAPLGDPAVRGQPSPEPVLPAEEAAPATPAPPTETEPVLRYVSYPITEAEIVPASEPVAEASLASEFVTESEIEQVSPAP